MKLRRIALQTELFSDLPRRTAHALPPEVRGEVVQLIESLLREVVQAQLPHRASPEASDEQD